MPSSPLNSYAFTPSPHGPRGFTLLEVLLTLALIGLLASVLVGGAAALMNDKPASADEVFWGAVQKARETALRSGRDVTLKFTSDQENGKAFLITGNGTVKSFPVPEAGDLEVSFLVAQTGGNLIMVGGTVLETQEVESVTFYADGTCSPFRVQFFRGGTSNIEAIDPWTCAQVLSNADTGPGGRAR